MTALNQMGFIIRPGKRAPSAVVKGFLLRMEQHAALWAGEEGMCGYLLDSEHCVLMLTLVTGP